MGRIGDTIAKLQGKEPHIGWRVFFINYVIKRPFDRLRSSFRKWRCPFQFAEEGEFRLITIDKEISLYWPLEYGWRSVFSVWEELFFDYPGNYFSLYTPKQDEVVIDAGASEGLFALKIRHIVGTIHLFEPIPKLCDSLRKTFKDEIADQKVFVCPYALGEKKGRVRFFLDTGVIGSSRAAREGDEQTVEVPITTIDGYVEENSIKRLDLIKMDIEGAEIDALKGAEKTLGTLRPRLLICTYHKPDDPERIGEFIQSFDYQLFYSDIVKLDGDRPLFRPAFVYAVPFERR